METILITGGAGFLGRHLAILLKDNYRVILGSRNNGNNQLAQIKTGCTVAPLDITNINSLLDCINEFKPDVIIHAAATKFVDISEQFPMECIDVNIIGSQNIARVAMEKGIKKVVGISTDKAAPPIGNIYGHSKAVMERLFCSMDGKSQTKFVCVRFGNIAWSTGSVFPLWERMVEEKGRIFSTGPEQRRFFFHVDEAAHLVISAMNNIDRLKGGILSIKMKSAQIENILDVWTKRDNIGWEKIESRRGDKLDEVLIGKIELPYCAEITIDSKEYYFINYKVKQMNSLGDEVSSFNADRLTDDEILTLINLKPKY